MQSMEQITQLSKYSRHLIANLPAQSSSTTSTITTLSLVSHPEGGYFVETDRDALLIANPFRTHSSHNVISYGSSSNSSQSSISKSKDDHRNAMTTIFYLLSPDSPISCFHRNKARTVFSLHWGRALYVILHADELEDPEHGRGTSKVRIETFIAGRDIENGERVQWIIEGGKYKAVFLLPDLNSDTSDKGMLISETVVPGFEYDDHNFLTANDMRIFLDDEAVRKLGWLLTQLDGQQEKLKLVLSR